MKRKKIVVAGIKMMVCIEFERKVSELKKQDRQTLADKTKDVLFALELLERKFKDCGISSNEIVINGNNSRSGLMLLNQLLSHG